MISPNKLLRISIWLLATSSFGRAGVIVDASVTGTSGAFSYAYQVENQTDVNIFLFSLTVSGNIDMLQSPNGWSASVEIIEPGQIFIQWISTDVPFDVPASGTLAGFLIGSDSGPGTVAFSTLDENSGEFDGQTTGPVASASGVPEPNSLVLFGTALTGIYVRRRFAPGPGGKPGWRSK